MSSKVTRMKRPRGLMRFFARIPIYLFDAGLGRLFGSRFVVLTHIGRNSGLPRKVALEVVRHDKSSDTYYVASGWGEEADWYRNVIKNPKIVIQAGSKRLPGIAERLPTERAEEELLTYARRYPTAIKSLAGIMGYEVDGTAEGYRALGRRLPIFALRPDPKQD